MGLFHKDDIDEGVEGQERGEDYRGDHDGHDHEHNHDHDDDGCCGHDDDCCDDDEEEGRPLSETDPEFNLIEEHLFDQIDEQFSIEPELAELVTLAVLTTTRSTGWITEHVESAIELGVSPDQIKETIYHCTPYVGIGTVEAAIDEADCALEYLDIEMPLKPQTKVADKDRLAKGIAAQKALFGEHIDQMRANAPADEKVIQDHLSAYCFGDFYTRGALDLKTRELLTVCAVWSLGGTEPQVKAHVAANIGIGNDRQVLLDALLLSMPWIGFPRTLNALACIDAVAPAK